MKNRNTRIDYIAIIKPVFIDECIGKMGEKMKKCDFIQKSACILYFAVIIYKPNA